MESIHTFHSQSKKNSAREVALDREDCFWALIAENRGISADRARDPMITASAKWRI